MLKKLEIRVLPFHIFCRVERALVVEPGFLMTHLRADPKPIQKGQAGGLSPSGCRHKTEPSAQKAETDS
jgi:hypothetical protein